MLVLEELCASGPILLDGATGTQLQARGLPIGACPEAWNLEHPDLVADVVRAYVEAGSQVVLANSFGGNRIALARYDLADQTEAINRAAVAAARQGAAGRALVFGSMGPTGRMFPVDPEETRKAFEEQASALAAAGADGLAVETMSDVEEAAICVRAAAGVGLPVVACMVFDSGKDRTRTMTGVTPERAAQELGEAGAAAIGANCGLGASQMAPICSRLRAATSVPIWAKPNAGLPQLAEGAAVYSQTPQEFVEEALELIRAGANFIGGCCGTGPEFIRLLGRAIKDGKAG
jgi:5-methyltetrahydrofolate--homocysteine methyltransferase